MNPLDDDELARLYESGMDTTQLAARFRVSRSTIANRLKRRGVKLRGRHYGRYAAKACERCGSTYTPSGPAARFCSDACRLGTARCESCGSEFVKRATQGSKSPRDNRFCSYECRWKAARSRDGYGRYLDSNGYVILDKRYSQREASRSVNANGYVRLNLRKDGRVLEHRHVMEQHLGRPLASDENVHHINGDKTDNRLENLELWVRSQPSGQRVTDLLTWARSILARYESEEQLLLF